jgi:hypothetical protein
MASKMAVTMALEMLQELYSEWEHTKTTERVWYLAMREINDEQLEQAVGIWITSRTSDYGAKPPLPGDIRKLALETVDRVSWDQAFSEIMNNAYRVMYPLPINGQNAPVEWSNSLLPDLMHRMGGAKYFINLSEDRIETARAQFRQMFTNEERRAGGVVPHQLHLTLSEPSKMTELQLSEYALDQAERILQPYRHALSEAQYSDQAVKLAGLIRERKRHKLRDIPQLPEPQPRQMSAGQLRDSAKLMARIQKHNPTPAQVVDELVKSMGASNAL